MDIKAAIFHHPEFTSFNQSVTALMTNWEQANTPLLKGIKVGDKPKAMIETISEDLLATFQKAPLLDAYDVYQHLMDYWAEPMQDDVYMIVSDGWKALADGKPNTDLIPQSLIIRRHFGVDQRPIEKLEADRDAIFREMEELEEEHGGEEGLLFEAKTEKGGLSKASGNARLKEIKGAKEAEDERKVLTAYAALIEKGVMAARQVKDAQKALRKQP